MPIKLSIDNNFLKVEGNDPERIYYERSRISHDIPTGTTIQLRYDNNKLARLDATTLDSSGAPFGSVAAIISFLTTAGDGDTNAGGTSGGSTLTQADVQTAMTNALLSQNQAEFHQSFLEDDNGAFLRTVNINEETGVTTTTNTTLAGAPYTPVGAIRLASQTTNDLLSTTAQTEKLYYAITAGVGYSVGDEIAWLYRLDGAVIWVNKTTRSAIAAPVLTDLVTNIEECFHEAVTATVPAATDSAFQTSGVGANSTFVNIPSIAGRRCNRISVLVGTPTATSPLFPTDVGTLLQWRPGGGLITTVLSSPNRPNQINIPGGGFTSWGWLMPESTRVVLQNTNLSSYPVTLRFWYSENAVETHNFGTNLPPGRQVTSEANITTGTASTLISRADIHSVQVLVDAVGATSNILFVLESFNAWHGLPATFRPVAEFVLPLGVTHGVFKTNVTSRFGSLRLRAAGTLTSFSYTLEINNDQY